MTNKKNTRRALFTSIMSLILCCAMLMGTTFAWFTDSVTSDLNQINSGNLDVELYHTDKNATNEKVTSNVKLFDDVTLWEPGAVAFENLQIANEGTLALKYQLALNFTNATETPEGKTLADVLKVAVVEGKFEGGRAEAQTLDYNHTLSTFSLAGQLAGDTKSETFGIVIYWQPSNDDNAFNMNNANQGKPLSIDLGVQLNATQLQDESDSFGSDYDEDAWANAMVVLTAEDLIAALANNDMVKLAADMEATAPIELTGNKAINLNGKTLTANLFAKDGSKVLIEGGSIKTANPDYSAIESTGTLTLNNVTVKSARHGVRVEGGTTVINGGYYEASGYAGRTQYALNVSDGGNVTINGGTFVGPKGTDSDSGSAVNVQADSTVTINGGNFSGGKTKTLASSGTLIVKGGTFDQDPTDYLATGYEAAESSGVWTVRFPQSSFDNLIATPDAEGNVNVPAGTFTFPTNVSEGVTINCADGTVFEGTSNLNINGATVIGATFSNEDGQAVSGTIDGTFKNCVFEGSEALRWCYTDADDEAVFENCVIETDFRGFHFDDMKGNVIFKNCEINGFNAYSGTGKMTFIDCTFGSDESAYTGLNIYSDTELINCTFNYTSGHTNFIDMEGTGKTLTITNCTATLDGAAANVVNFVGGSKLANNTVIVDGNRIAKDAASLNNALSVGNDIVLTEDVTAPLSNSAIYGTPVAVIQKGGTFDGNGNSLNIENPQYNGYAIETYGGTIKNLTIDTAVGRGIVISSPTEDIYIDNVIVDGPGYAINTTEHNGKCLYITNSTIKGWTSLAGLNSVSFTNCNLGENTAKYWQNMGYDQDYDRLVRPYVTSVFTNCAFEQSYYIDLSALGADCSVTLDSCTVNGTEVTANNYSSLITIELPSGRTVADCVIFK